MCSRTIVLAENDRRDEELILLALENAAADVDVVVLSDGEAVVDFFLRKLKRNRLGGLSRAVAGDRWQASCVSHDCDLLLLDLAIPKLNGFKVLWQLRWLHRDDLSALPPIVALSDSDDNPLIAEAYRCGASGFLCTSASVSRFANALRQTVHYWLGATLRPYADTVQKNSSRSG
jgi:DNA-binding NarL/FixJ family response regulator